MNNTVKRLIRYVITFCLIALLQALMFSLLINQEHYPWPDQFLEAVTLSVIYNAFAFFIFILLFKVIIKTALIFVQALITAALTALFYWVVASLTYMGVGMNYKLIVILSGLFIGSFLIPYFNNWIKSKQSQ